MVFFFFAHAVEANDTISPETLKAAKRATAFIRVAAPAGEFSGSGFVIARDGQAALIVTNHHVIAAAGPDPSRPLPGKSRRRRKSPGLPAAQCNSPT